MWVLFHRLLRSLRIRPLAVASCLGIHAVLLVYSAGCHSPVPDEVGHLPAAILQWQTRRFDLFSANPPLVRWVAAIPVLHENFSVMAPDERWPPRVRAEFAVGCRLIHTYRERILRALVHARWAVVPFSMLGGYICWCWARALFGETPGWVSLLLWCFSPNVLGHAALITPDVPAASLGVAACYAFWRWLKSGSIRWAIGSGLLLGCAELSKFTWVILFLLWPVLWQLCRIVNRDVRETSWRRQVCQLAGLLSISVWVINCGYLFDGTGTRLAEFEFTSRALSLPRGVETSGESGNRFRGTWLGEIPIPLPKDYLVGIDLVKYEYERGALSYLRGRHREGGWWYYYLFAMVVKTPVGTLLLVASSVTLLGARFIRVSWCDLACLILPAACLIGLVSSQTGFNHHLRYALPAFPFLIVVASAAAQLLYTVKSTLRYAPVLLAGCSIISSLREFPHGLSYFNELAGGPENGWKLLDNSNIDWGQDLPSVKSWQESHPMAWPLFVVNSSYVHPREFGITCHDPVPELQTTADGRVEMVFEPGWYVIGVHSMVSSRSSLQSFTTVTPVALIGYSMRVFHLTKPLVVRQSAGEGR